MKNIEFDREEIEGIFHRAERSLFSESNIQWFAYEVPFNYLNTSEVIIQVQNVPMVDCIWISDGIQPKPVYLGHSFASLSKQRLINHFIKKKDPRTGSQLERVKKAVSERHKIGLSFLKIEPDYMRKPLEEWLIVKDSEKLVWNIHGRRKLK